MAQTDDGARRTLMRWAGIDPDLPYDPEKVEVPEIPDGKGRTDHSRYGAAFSTLSDNRLKVGLLTPCLCMGGGESWMLSLMKQTQSSLNWVGVVVAESRANAEMVAATSKYAPVQFGLDKVADLASRCDVLVSWLVEDHDRWMGGAKCKLIWVTHFAQDKPINDFTMRLIQRADKVVGVSELCSPGFPDSWKIGLDARYRVIYNGIDLDKLVIKRNKATMRAAWNVPTSAKVAGYYGRIAEIRRPDQMIRLASALPADWHVVLVGDSAYNADEAAYLARMISQLPASVQSRIHIQPADMNTGDVMGAFDVMVDPSSADSFGLSKVEAMAAGVAVVASPVGVAKLYPGYVYPIAIDDTPANLASQVQKAKLLGPKLLAQTFATTTCGPTVFGLAWSTLISSTAGLRSFSAKPSMPAKALSFGKAMVSHAVQGFPQATPEETERRKAICQTCPFFQNAGCTKCDCPSRGLAMKWKMRDKHCPIYKWGPNDES